MKKTTGWILVAAAIGMFCNMVAIDIAQLPAWETVRDNPAFVGKLVGYLGTVLTAFAAGKLLPNGD